MEINKVNKTLERDEVICIKLIPTRFEEIEKLIPVEVEFEECFGKYIPTKFELVKRYIPIEFELIEIPYYSKLCT